MELVAPAGPPRREPLVLGRYRLVRRLGSGGFGTVYEAHDEHLDRRVAVKVIPADAPAPRARAARGRAAARLDHPAIVALYEAGEEDGSALPRLGARPRAARCELEADGALSDRDVLRIGLALRDALAHAHARGVSTAT